MTAHAKFSFSSTARWLKCPASVALAATVTPRMSGMEADEGTRVHKSIERAIESNMKSGDISEDHEHFEAVYIMLKYIEKLPSGTVMSETKTGFNEVAWGTFDVGHVPEPIQVRSDEDAVFTMVDYKNGAMDVAAVENMQGLSYGSSWYHEKPKRWVKFFRFVIIQPNSRTNGEQPPVKQWIVPVQRLVEHRDQVLRAIERAEQGELPQPGPHCKYCPAFGVCPATLGMLPFLEQTLRMAPHEVPDEAIVRAARVLKGFEDLRKNLDKEILRRILGGTNVPQASTKTGRTHRQWADPMQAAKRLYEAYGALGIEAISPAQAEKLGDAGRETASLLARAPPGQLTVSY